MKNTVKCKVVRSMPLCVLQGIPLCMPLSGINEIQAEERGEMGREY